MAALGLRTRFGDHLLDRYGYLAGRDEDRAADVNTMFADSEVRAVLALRGGWGCNRLLPLLDYEMIRNNPKIIMGMSDITGLLLGIYAKTSLVTFHGPTGNSQLELERVHHRPGQARALRRGSPLDAQPIGDGRPVGPG